MCGIVGLFLKDAELAPEFGALLETMLETMTARGPDSAGFAVYGDTQPDALKVTVRGSSDTDFKKISEAISSKTSAPIKTKINDTHAVFRAKTQDVELLRQTLSEIAPDLEVVSIGSRMEIYKEVGLPAEVANRFNLAANVGSTRSRSYENGDRICGHDRWRSFRFQRRLINVSFIMDRSAIIMACEEF